MTISGFPAPQQAALSVLQNADRSLPSGRDQAEASSTLVRQLKTHRKDLDEQRKKAARRKIERLKARIQALRLMGGDPKAIARQAARLAKELAGAVKEYAAAGGGAGSAGTVMGAAALAASPPAPSPAAAMPAAEADEIRTRVAEQFAKGAEQAAEAKADSEFAADARNLMDQLRAIIKHAKQRMQGGRDEDAQAAEQALRETGTALDEIAAGKLMGSVDILA